MVYGIPEAVVGEKYGKVLCKKRGWHFELLKVRFEFLIGKRSKGAKACFAGICENAKTVFPIQFPGATETDQLTQRIILY